MSEHFWEFAVGQFVTLVTMLASGYWAYRRGLAATAENTKQIKCLQVKDSNGDSPATSCEDTP